jgi:hypothetical protein
MSDNSFGRRNGQPVDARGVVEAADDHFGSIEQCSVRIEKIVIEFFNSALFHKSNTFYRPAFIIIQLLHAEMTAHWFTFEETGDSSRIIRFQG